MIPEPPFTEAHEAFRARAREFVLDELRPHAEEWEEAGWFPNAVFGALASRGWLGLKYGGDWVADAVLAEELARCGSGGVAAGIGAHIHIATPPIFRFGTEEQRTRWLEPAVRGELIGALAITEPDAGSDVASIRTRAVAVDGGWLVSGAKTFITNGVRADFYVTAVRTGGEGHGGLSFLVVERGEGLTASALSKLGWRASDTAELAFDEVFVPREHLLGELDGGFKLIMANFQWERLVMALGAVGAMRRTLERAVAELPGRGQATRHKVAELATRAQAGTALTYHALRRYLDGGDAIREVTMAKLATQRANFEFQDECLRLMGPDAELERAVRDARLGPIGGGTDEIMREILGRSL
ncbi:MAG TPA: acyl-CoA dehydrogenase family protein [Solirubrobacteraceae bacterium]|nr:acyl-CoA dehydrogenase family protein [Solirubrobacteraceae bacterium]